MINKYSISYLNQNWFSDESESTAFAQLIEIVLKKRSKQMIEQKQNKTNENKWKQSKYKFSIIIELRSIDLGEWKYEQTQVQNMRICK